MNLDRSDSVKSSIAASAAIDGAIPILSSATHANDKYSFIFTPHTGNILGLLYNS
ncbi:hypothetical protein [Tychonema sp. BBK16]|uniref:hypothetical protein n=1 Tax=Tychonema sp. BBK16 TaxID=2699888 RepID=UPI001F42DDB4|nr:hypothetical protein [Tychonema sp. BBK16]MCF6372447.1 hypothetical protein [Tychonema sp. BBK16]